jgi:FixJ family two-component response regulator
VFESASARRETGKAVYAEAGPCVFIVDDDVSVRESLELLLASVGLHAVAFGCAADFLAHSRPRTASCLVLDVGLPDVNGLDLQARCASNADVLPIVFITGSADVPTAVRAMKGGAMEFLTKPLAADALLDAIDRALDASRAALRRASDLAALRERCASLSPREREVMTLVVAGRLNKQVADALGISEITVKAHRGKVMRKMAARSLPDLVRMAAALDCVDDGQRC